jgi:type IV secretion system protein TrbJ
MKDGRMHSSERVGRRATTICLLAAAALLPVPARAQLGLPGVPQVVLDPTAVGKLVTQLSRQAQQIATAKSQLQAQVDNMRKLANPNWRTINTTVASIDVLARQGQAISYSLANIDAQFRSTFAGYQTYGDLRATTRTQNERTLATLRGVLNATNATAQQFPVSSSTLNAMKSQLRAITSAQQAAELNGSIGILTAEEMTLLRQQLAAQANAQAVTLANQINRDLQGAAAAAAFEAAGARAPVARQRRTAAVLGWAP